MAIDAQINIIEDIRQSPEYASYLTTIGWEVVRLKVSQTNVFLRKTGPISLVKIQRTNNKLDAQEIKQLLHERKVFMCKIEPGEQITTQQLDCLSRQGFRLSNWPLLGTKTSRIDLSVSENDIFSGFKKDCRYCIRRAESIDDIKPIFGDTAGFYDIWKASARRKNLWIPSKKDFQSLISAFGNKVLVVTIDRMAGAVVLMHKKTAFYYYAGATADGVKHNFPYCVVWTAIKEAKKRGCKIWDFEGIYDARWPNKGWSGFTHFKKSFSGVEIEYPGSFEKWRWPF